MWGERERPERREFREYAAQLGPTGEFGGSLSRHVTALGTKVDKRIADEELHDVLFQFVG